MNKGINKLISLRLDINIPVTATAAANEDKDLFGYPLTQIQANEQGVFSIKGIAFSIVGNRVVSGRFQLQINGITVIDTILKAKWGYQIGCNEMLPLLYDLPALEINKDALIQATFLPLNVKSEVDGGTVDIDPSRRSTSGVTSNNMPKNNAIAVLIHVQKTA